MSHQEYPASTLPPASILLPSADALPLAAAKRSSVKTFTKTTVRSMHCPAGRAEKFFWDIGCRGFGIRALNSGRRSWLYQYRDGHGRTRRLVVLGDVSAVTLEDARGAARRAAAAVVHGSNPSVDRRKKRIAGTVLDLIDDYLRHVESRLRDRSYKETERHLRVHAAALHYERVEAVRRLEIAALFDSVRKRSGPVAANRVRATLSALWTWGLRTGLIEGDSNPVAFTVRNPERPRERVLADAELKAVWAATDDDRDYPCIVRLCLLTGCRRREIAGLRWEEVRADRIVIASNRMKGDISHEIALLPMILAALPQRPNEAEGTVFGKQGTGFSGFSKCKRELDVRIAKSGVQIPRWGLHDLRRTVSTRLHDAGVEPIVIEALLAHKQQGVAAIYNRASFREAKRAALLRWHEIIGEVIRNESL